MEIKIYSPTSHKIKALIYGDSGTWKTSFWATAPNVIFASAEAGMLSLGNKKIPYVEIKSLKDLQDLYLYLAKWGHKFETVVIDSISEINDLIKTELEAKRGRPLQIQDWGEIAKQIENILRKFRGLDMHVIMIAQEQVERDDQKITKYVPSLNWKTATKIAYFMDIVGHIEITATWEHIINTVPSPKYLTKDRTWRLGNNIAPDFNLWTLAVESLEITDEEETFYNWEFEDETEEVKPQKPAPTIKKIETPKAAKVEAPKTPEAPAVPKEPAMAKPMVASAKQIVKIRELYELYKEKKGAEAKPLESIIGALYKIGGEPLKGLEDLTIKFASDLIKRLEEQVK